MRPPCRRTARARIVLYQPRQQSRRCGRLVGSRLFQLYLSHQRRLRRNHAGVGLRALGGDDRADERRAVPGHRHLETDLAARQAELDAREEKIKQQEKLQQDAAIAQRRTDITSFADGLVTAGQLLPRQKNAVVEVLVSLANEPVSFADGSTTVSKTPEELLRSVLSEKPKLLDFAEKSAEDGAAALDFADVNAVAELARDYQATEAAKGRTISMTVAVNHVKGGKK